VLLCTLLLFSSILSLTAFAGNATVSTSTGASYFQTFNSQGVWTDILTPNHTVNETGAVAYCIQPAKDSPYGSGYTEGMGWSAYSETTRLGFQAILEHGYPNSNGGFTDAQARYATANAIRFWVAEQGCSSVLDWMDLTRFSQFFRAKSGYEALFNWSMELLNYARNGTVTRHGVVLSDPVLSENSSYFIVTTTVSLENCSWGYTYDEGLLPPDTEVYGYTGNHGDTLTFYVPLEYEGYDLDISVTGYDHRTGASVLYYGPDNTNEQRLIAYAVNANQIADDDFESVTLISGAPEPTGTIRIIKTDSVTGEPLEGVWFYLYGPNNDFYSEPTNADGIIEWPVPPGDYRYKESAPPDGYVGDTTRYKTKSVLGEVTEIHVTNDPIAQTPSSIEITKTDSESGAVLSGAEIGLYDSSYNLISTATTGADGKVTFTDLNKGTYYYREITSPTGYIQDKDYHQVVISLAGSTITDTLENTQALGTLSISKTDYDTGAALSGVEFSIYDSAKNYLNKGTTDSNGKLSFEKLPIGSYYCRETKAPDGYTADDSYYAFELTYDGELVSVSVTNKAAPKTGSITVQKIDAYGNKLPGAVFTLESSADGSTWTSLAETTSDTNGLVVFSELASGDTIYRVTETKAPPGHSLLAGVIYEGKLSSDDLDLSFTACDCAIPMLPFTGSTPNLISIMPLMLCMSIFYALKRKENVNEKV